MEKTNPILSQIENIMKDFKGQPDFKISMDTRIDALGLDSLDTVSLMMDIEDKLGVTVEMSKETVTIGDVVKVIDAQKKAVK